MLPATLRRVFSVPRYLSMPAAGIDISDQSIKFVEIIRAPYGVRIKSHGQQGLAKDVVTLGQITNQQRLADELAVVREKLTTSFVNVSLPEEQAYLFSTTVPRMKADAIRDSLSLQMERFVPIPLKDVIFDFDVVSVVGDMFEVQVVVIDRKTVFSYLDVFEKAGLRVAMFEIEPQSTARALLPAAHKGAVVVVDLGDTHTGVSVVADGYVLFTAASEVTGARIENLIVNMLKVDKIEARRRKEKHGILKHPEMEGVYKFLIEAVDELARDVQKTVQYWQTQQTRQGNRVGGTISRILFCGGHALMPGLLPHLQAIVPVPIERGDPWVRLRFLDNQYVPLISPAESLAYASAIGLAVAGIEHD